MQLLQRKKGGARYCGLTLFIIDCPGLQHHVSGIRWNHDLCPQLKPIPYASHGVAGYSVAADNRLRSRHCHVLSVMLLFCFPFWIDLTFPFPCYYYSIIPTTQTQTQELGPTERTVISQAALSYIRCASTTNTPDSLDYHLPELYEIQKTNQITHQPQPCLSSSTYIHTPLERQNIQRHIRGEKFNGIFPAR